MDKKRLMTLIKRYSNEVTSGDMNHLEDLIAAMVISDLTAINDSYLVQHGVDAISLASLLGINGDEYTIPNKYELYDNRKRLENNSKFKSFISQEEVAANTWIDMMVKTNMVNELETINPNEYILSKFVKDNNLRDVLPLTYKPKTRSLNTSR